MLTVLFVLNGVKVNAWFNKVLYICFSRYEKGELQSQQTEKKPESTNIESDFHCYYDIRLSRLVG